MDYSLPAADSSQRSTWTRSNRAELRRPFDVARWTTNRGEMEKFAVIGKHVTVSRLAEPDRSLEHRVEDRGEVARRGVDDLQHLGSCSLPLQRLVTLSFGIVTLSFGFGQLAPQIGYELLRIG